MTDETSLESVPRFGGLPAERQAFAAYLEALSDGRAEIAGRHYTDDVFFERPGLAGGEPVRYEGKDAVVGYFSELFAKFHEDIQQESMIADRDGICSYHVSTFTALEDALDFESLPLALGETLTVSCYMVYGLRDGKIASIQLALP